MKRINTKYYIDYICKNVGGRIEAYHQLVRTKDEAILYANASLDNVFLHCFHAGINKSNVTIL